MPETQKESHKDLVKDDGTSGSSSKEKRAKLYMFEGVPMMTSRYVYNEKIRNYKAKADDVLVATYPKAGVDMLDTMPSPRLVKTHLPMKLVPPSFWDNNCRIIYVARNAKDVLVSYYFFHKMNFRMPEPGSWEEFFESFLSGKVAWGSWFDHVTNWWDIRERHRVLFIFYEDLVQDTMREVERVAHFLGHTLERTTLDEIVKHTAFSNMKDNPMTNFAPLAWCIQEISPFMRKGEVGDWKNHLTVAQNERFEEEYRRRMAKTSLRFTDDL
ncbi:ST1C2 Sulfotransferase, partial [Polypterus senegalus]